MNAAPSELGLRDDALASTSGRSAVENISARLLFAAVASNDGIPAPRLASTLTSKARPRPKEPSKDMEPMDASASAKAMLLGDASGVESTEDAFEAVRRDGVAGSIDEMDNAAKGVVMGSACMRIA